MIMITAVLLLLFGTHQLSLDCEIVITIPYLDIWLTGLLALELLSLSHSLTKIQGKETELIAVRQSLLLPLNKSTVSENECLLVNH